MKQNGRNKILHTKNKVYIGAIFLFFTLNAAHGQTVECNSNESNVSPMLNYSTSCTTKTLKHINGKRASLCIKSNDNTITGPVIVNYTSFTPTGESTKTINFINGQEICAPLPARGSYQAKVYLYSTSMNHRVNAKISLN